MEVNIKKYTFEELDAEEQKFELLSEKERGDLAVSLHELLLNATPEEDYEGRYSYFRWYTDLVWYDMLTFNKENFVPIVVERQIFEAILLGFDVWKKIIVYFDRKCLESDEYRTLFIQTKDAFVNSRAIIGGSQGNFYRVADAVNEKILLRSRGNDSIEAAEFLNKLKRMAALDNNQFAERFLPATSEDVLRDFNDLMDFFLDTDPDDAELIVDMYVHPEAYGLERAPRGGIEASVVAAARPATPARAPAVGVPAAVSMPVAPVAAPVAVKAAEKTVSVPAAAPKPSYAEIRDKIDAAFEKDAEGNYEDLNLVADSLQKAAEKYNDPKIAELYYFDESAGKFKWNV